MSDTVSSQAGRPATLTNPIYSLPLAAAAVEVIGSIGPWAKASIGGFTDGGLNGGGKATLALAAIIITLVILAYRGRREVQFVRLLLNAVLVIVIALANVADVKSTDVPDLGSASFSISVGWGLWVTLFGGVLMALALAKQQFAR